jgi:hypothetical protein
MHETGKVKREAAATRIRIRKKTGWSIRFLTPIQQQQTKYSGLIKTSHLRYFARRFPLPGPGPIRRAFLSAIASGDAAHSGGLAIQLLFSKPRMSDAPDTVVRQRLVVGGGPPWEAGNAARLGRLAAIDDVYVGVFAAAAACRRRPNRRQFIDVIVSCDKELLTLLEKLIFNE